MHKEESSDSSFLCFLITDAGLPALLFQHG